ncbi:Uncharacterised protein (plasmid) [Legionella adelaidensis]|uniref:Uncharacterized protein n=1 Tax=Legionella adelaidensis TaxID=45056 RepID=A0A0W0R5M1_9GAMM|nr:hypothetical protein [Legionella adelaidensis]KTC66318.1 hypothetical protein Lade_0976 [Legionella adelaidensis]VEH84914.1 Uncharacterised protein [Legionella adelaidensis]
MFIITMFKQMRAEKEASYVEQNYPAEEGYFTRYPSHYDFFNDVGSLFLKMWDCFLGSVLKLLLTIKSIMFALGSLLILNLPSFANNTGSALYHGMNTLYLLSSIFVDSVLKLISIGTRTTATIFTRSEVPLLNEESEPEPPYVPTSV